MSEQLDLPKFHLDPGMDHLPAHHHHRQYGKSLHFSPARVVQVAMFLIIKQRGPLLPLFEVVKIRFDWPSGYSPFLIIEGVYREGFGIKEVVRVSHSMSPRENASWHEAVRSTVAKFPGHQAIALVTSRRRDLTREAASLQRALQLLESPKIAGV